MSDAKQTPVLHILNKAPDHPRARTCLEQLASGDALLLIENGVMALSLESWLGELPRGVLLSALEPDMAVRGIQAPAHGITVTDYGGFVSMVCQWPRTIYW